MMNFMKHYCTNEQMKHWIKLMSKLYEDGDRIKRMSKRMSKF